MWSEINHTLDRYGFWSRMCWLSVRAPEVDIMGPSEGRFHQILPWLMDRVAKDLSPEETEKKRYLKSKYQLSFSSYYSLGKTGCKWIYTISDDKDTIQV